MPNTVHCPKVGNIFTQWSLLGYSKLCDAPSNGWAVVKNFTRSVEATCDRDIHVKADYPYL